MGLPGGGRRRNQGHICPQLTATSPGSAEALSGDASMVFVFFCVRVVAVVTLGRPVFILGGPLITGWFQGTGAKGVVVGLVDIGHLLCLRRNGVGVVTTLPKS
jgi:hypothetical protein